MASASRRDLHDVGVDMMTSDHADRRSPYDVQGEPSSSPGSLYFAAQRSVASASEGSPAVKNRASVIAGDFIKVDTEASDADMQAKLSAASKLQGAALRVLTNPFVGNLMAGVVVVDAMCTWIDIDSRAAGKPPATFVEVFADTALVLYSLEMLLRLTGKGLSSMVSDWISILDVVVVVCGFAEIMLKALTPTDFVATKLSVMRALRLARIVRLLQFFRRTLS